MKKGPLFETSPMLNDISGVPTWAKVRRSTPTAALPRATKAFRSCVLG